MNGKCFPFIFSKTLQLLIFMCIFIAGGLYWIHCYYKTRRGGWQESVWSCQNCINQSNTGLRQQVNWSCAQGTIILGFRPILSVFYINFTSLHVLFSIMQIVDIFIVGKLFRRFKLGFFFICMYLPLCHLTTKLLKLKVWKLESRLVTHTYTLNLLCINVINV